MQFSLVVLLTIATAVSAHGPGPLRMRQDTCNMKQCVLDLAPSALSCLDAAKQDAANLISDASCIIGAIKDVVELPASCTGCADQLGLSGDVASAENVIGDGISSAENAIGDGIESAESAIGDFFGGIF
ncbi:hypothetical protein C8R46DRAFT_1185618 [Mycena filopes]|nr:hypothetical protein C8R46DRAFT_1185618 [Mycena filopes]